MIEFVAEFGQTMRGDVGLAVEMVHQFAQAGATAIKVQMLRPETLTTSFALSYWKTGPQVVQGESFAASGLIAYDAWGPVRSACDECGVGFVATPFDLDALAALVDLDPAAIKVASGDITFLPLLDAIGALDHPRVLLSTGAASRGEIYQALERLGPNPRETVLLACTLAYPCPQADANLGRIGWLAEWGRHVGYSDHTDSAITASSAVLAGARLLEKHVTPYPGDGGVPDDMMGLSAAAFAEYVAHGKHGERLLGDHQGEPAEVEMAARAGARRAARYARPLIAGAAHLRADDVTYLRPDPDGDGRSIAAASFALSGGAMLRRDVAEGDLVTMSDFAADDTQEAQ